MKDNDNTAQLKSRLVRMATYLIDVKSEKKQAMSVFNELIKEAEKNMTEVLEALRAGKSLPMKELDDYDGRQSLS